MSAERLQKVLASAGIASRRDCEELIAAGRVTVNGRVVQEPGARVDLEQDTVLVDGQPVQMPAERTYLMLHKPAGFVSTVDDPHGRPTVLDLVDVPARVFPVGRLDVDSEGLLLLTDDGELTHYLTHPRHEVEKEYRALLDRPLDAEALRQWRAGVLLNGEMTAPAWVDLIEQTDEGAWTRVVLREGRKRQIREVARLLGYEVLRLIRVREGELQLGDLPLREWRKLSEAEVAALRAHVPEQREEQPRDTPPRRREERPRNDAPRGNRAPREGNDRPRGEGYGNREQRGYGDRGRGDAPRFREGYGPFRDDRRGYGDRPRGEGYGNREQRYDRPRGEGYGNREQRYDRPRGEGYGNREQRYDRPRGEGYGNRERGYGDRPRGEGYGNREQRYDRPRGEGYGNRERGYGDRPRGEGYGNRERGYGDRPRGEGYGNRERGYGDRPRGEGYGNRERGYGDRPRGEGYGNRERGYGDRPRGEGYGNREQRYDRPRGEGYGNREQRYDRPRGEGYGNREQREAPSERPASPQQRAPRATDAERPQRRDDAPVARGGFRSRAGSRPRFAIPPRSKDQGDTSGGEE